MIRPIYQVACDEYSIRIKGVDLLYDFWEETACAYGSEMKIRDLDKIQSSLDLVWFDPDGFDMDNGCVDQGIKSENAWDAKEDDARFYRGEFDKEMEDFVNENQGKEDEKDSHLQGCCDINQAGKEAREPAFHNGGDQIRECAAKKDEVKNQIPFQW